MHVTAQPTSWCRYARPACIIRTFPAKSPRTRSRSLSHKLGNSEVDEIAVIGDPYAIVESISRVSEESKVVIVAFPSTIRHPDGIRRTNTWLLDIREERRV